MITNSKTRKHRAFIYILIIPIIGLMSMTFSSFNTIPQDDGVLTYSPLKESDIERIAVNHNETIKDPFTKNKRVHYGIDIKAKEGTPVYAAGNGSAIIVEEKDGWGNLIVLKHGTKYETWYAHLKGFTIKKGQNIKAGQLIGYVGNTGKSTAAHLHFEIRKDGEKVNPNEYIDIK